MAFKRKLDFDDETADAAAPKQLKLVPFPSYDADNDVAMSDSSSSDPFRNWTAGARPTAVSMVSTASNYSCSAPASPDVLNNHLQSDDGMLSTSLPKPTGLIGCGILGSSFQHHNANCTQLPKLRMACSAGPGRARTMWSSCEQCGAIAMVELD